MSGAKKLSKSKQFHNNRLPNMYKENTKHTVVNDEIIEQLQRATEAKARESVVKPVLQSEIAKNVSKVAETK